MSRMKRNGQRGTAILITMLLTVSILAGGAVLVGMQLSGTRSVDVARQKEIALHCAEAGLAAARRTIALNYANWTASLCNPPSPAGTGACAIGLPANEPTWLTSAISHDIDGDTVNDFTITLVDNEDEIAPTANNMALDNDLQVYIVSTCLKFPDLKQQVRELVKVNPGNTCYGPQRLACSGGGGN